MRKGIEGFKKKPIKNPSLNESFLLLVYEYPKTQTRGKYLGHSGDGLEDTRSSNYSNSKEFQSLSSKSEDNTHSKGKNTKGGEKISPSTSIVPSRKIPRGLTPDPPKEYEEDEYNDEDEKMELEEKKGEDSEKKKEDITIFLGKPQEKEGQGGFIVRRDKRSHS